MSDLASTSALLKTSPQLPVDWYVDQRAKAPAHGAIWLVY